jgi:hypothetical protein
MQRGSAQGPGLRVPMAVLAMAGGALLGVACSAVLDGDRHRGGDGGSPDDGDIPMADGSGDAAGPDPCQAPPTAACGQPVDEACPPTVPDGLAQVFPDRTPLALLLPTTVLEGADAYAPDIAAASIPVLGGGHGTTVLLAMAERGPGDHAPVRIDVPLDDLPAADIGPLPDGEADLSDTASVTSIAAQPLASAGSTRVVFHLGNSAGDERWAGFTDLASVQTSLSRATGALFDDVGTMPAGIVTRWNGPGPPEMESITIAQGALGIGGTDIDVPGDERLRMVSSTGGAIMLQDLAGGFWFWETLAFNDVYGLTVSGQDGKAAWVHVSGGDHVLAWHRNGDVHFDHMACPFNGNACDWVPIVTPADTMSTIAPTGEVPDGVALEDGRVAVLVIEHYEAGDRLVLQVLDASLTTISLPRIEVLDLRDAGERVTDARLGRVETATASTLVVTVAIGATTDAASRVVMTGLRSCQE